MVASSSTGSTSSTLSTFESNVLQIFVFVSEAQNKNTPVLFQEQAISAFSKASKQAKRLL